MILGSTVLGENTWCMNMIISIVEFLTITSNSDNNWMGNGMLEIWYWLQRKILFMARIELIFLTFSSTCSEVHQHKMGFECPCNRLSSSKDSTNGAPNVSGSNKVNAADIKLVAPKIIKGSSLNVITGRYKAS